MRRKTISCLALIPILFSCSSNSGVQILRKPINNIKEDYYRPSDDFVSLVSDLNTFSAEFVEKSVKELDDKKTNSSVSPISMYSALAVASVCASGNTRSQILNALKTDESLLGKAYAELYERSNISRNYGHEFQTYRREILTNSIWIDNSLPVKEETLDLLADKFCSYSVSADYKNNARSTNRKMSNFVSENTKGLLKPDFDFGSDTKFTILNTLYLKSLWNELSYELPYADEKYDFISRDETKKRVSLLETAYKQGQILKEEKFSSFFAETAAGDRLKFMVPNDGYNLDDIFNENSLEKVLKTEYPGIDDVNKIVYETRAHFPAFKAKGKLTANDCLKGMGITDLFNDSCDYSNLTNESVYCDKVEHVSALEVDKKGIEGAAYTAMANCGAAGPLEGYTFVYDTFVVDRAFAYVVSDNHNVPLFAGIVNNI